VLSKFFGLTATLMGNDWIITIE